MHQMKKGLTALAVVSLVLSAACNKGPAQEALAEADRALAAAQPDLERYVPEALAEIKSATADARSMFGEGRYTEALRVAQDLPMKIQVAAAAAAVVRNEMAGSGKEISAAAPGLVQAITAKVAELEAASRLPKGVDAATFTAARTDLDSVTRAWSEATAAFQGGDVPRAVRTARDVRAKLEALSSLLGLTPAAEPAAPVR